ncbi:MAG: Asp-tRNA(Asn)/Glu-tRNA(Gln) amidotransferase subunit GatB [bacterium]|nr:Asp-tRNA(Asn)/Glu-tRNA(Gln) amidotransferase subunit GatB [bacterium]
MSKYIPTIGLEVHAELRTKTKMFCDCPNNSDEIHPNTNVCPICLGHPGTLPTINKKAVEMVIKLGFALGSEISPNFKFDRKNYFYPDLPKGYQISQFDQPIVKGGQLSGVKINRVHLEEDAAKLLHAPDGRSSLVDFNRGGVPLMELVTEPDIHGIKEASAFVRELQSILRYLEISDADLEKGQMRVDAIISLTYDQRPTTNDQLGTKVEIKNLNSFRAIEEALNYEIERQSQALDSGSEIAQETRGWNDIKKITTSQRSKEQAHDYRYFPEPDLPPLTSDAFDLKAIKLSVPELPAEKRERFQKQYGLQDIQAALLVEERLMAQFFEETVSELEEENDKTASPEQVKLVFNYLTSDLRGLMAELEAGFRDMKITAENFADLIKLIASGGISSRVAKDVLRKMMETGLDPREIVKQEGLEQVSGGEELELMVKKIVEENPNAVADYKKGKTNALQFLVGKAMGALRGRGHPEVLRKLFEEELIK